MHPYTFKSATLLVLPLILIACRHAGSSKHQKHPPQLGGRIELVSHMDGDYWGVELDGDLLVAGIGQYPSQQSEIHTFSLVDPCCPKKLGSFQLPSLGHDMALRGKRVFATDWLSNLHIHDLNRQGLPISTHCQKLTGEVYRLKVRDTAGFCAPGTCRLDVWDLSDTKKLGLMGSCELLAQATGISVFKSLAYVSVGELGIQILDISDPRNPTPVAHLDTPGFAFDVATEHGIVYVADWEAGLQVIDATTSEAPRVLGYFDTPGHTQRLFLSGSLLYLADRWNGLFILDVSKPSKPLLLDSYNLPGTVMDIAEDDGLFCVATLEAGLFILRYDEP